MEHQDQPTLTSPHAISPDAPTISVQIRPSRIDAEVALGLAAVTTILADGGGRAMALAEAVGAVHVLTPRGSLLSINTPRELQRARSAA